MNNISFNSLKYVTFFCFCLIHFNAIYGKETVKVMTINIRLETASDAENQWKYRKEKMVEFLILESADFICVQEAMYNQVQYLDSALADYQYIGVGRDDGKKGGEFMALFYKVNKWSIENENTFWLSDTPDQCSRGWDAMCHRVCTWGTFISRSSGKKVIISNTHLDHKGEIARSKSVELLINHLSKIDQSILSILAGDFNLSPKDVLYQKLTQKLIDTKMLAENINETYEGTFNGFDKGEYKPSYNYRIDFVFLNKERKVLDYRVPIVYTEKGLHITDHFPVMVNIEMD